ncbi:RNA-binding domain superfamily [Arabidopsis thaliana x Arabidopsis arenosa]|uniref:RNA-binding domain superfamily n=1 Tax=Arabidopsis thaliana x Arabidopsis arenosa TaxID=1240361 RepID=A0A8T1XQP7_9BRAS|nr:RNA-binding domain superfamily [Arabidopsis thaliana x Arabidopsis arenosa]
MSQHGNFDTTFTKIYVENLPWTTRKEGLVNFFKRFGEIIHANIVFYRKTDRSKGYGFVTFKDAESARNACKNPNPTIDGRVTNCKLASLGAKVKPNQSKIIPLAHDDLCFKSPSFCQNLQQPSNFPQPVTTNPRPQWNQVCPQHPQQHCCNSPQHYLQYNPQYVPVSYKHYHLVDDTNQCYWLHQSINAVNGESSSLQATGTLTEFLATQGSSLSRSRDRQS